MSERGKPRRKPRGEGRSTGRSGRSNRGNSGRNSRGERPVDEGGSTGNSTKSWHRNVTRSQTSGANKENEPEEDDGKPLCVVCASPFNIAALSPCNHVVCHMCGFRQRALYEKKACLICRTDAERLIFTDNPPESFHYDDVSPAAIKVSSEKYGIDFTSQTAKDATMGLLDWRCPVPTCKGKKFPNFKQLNEHTRETHNLVYCNLCAKYKKAFPEELKLYTTRELQIHQSKGDEEGFKGHPACKFCHGKRFYSDDELFVHMREKHERCHVCDQIDSSNPQYFKDYNDLFHHFQDAHFICSVQSCLDKKFVVFRDEFELQAHMIKEHSDIYGTDKIIMSSGLNARGGFGSHLSTLSAAERAADPGNVPSDSREVKQLRLEERARHYLHYDQDRFKEFQDANKKYTNGRLNENELLKEYKQIFEDKDKSSKDSEEGSVDYSVLIYEMSRLFPSSSSQRKALESLNMQSSNPVIATKRMEDKFPELPGSSQQGTVIGGGWGSRAMRQGVSSSSSSRNDLFPALPTAQPVRFFKTNSRPTRQSGWAPPLNASSVPGYFPTRGRGQGKGNGRNSGTTSDGYSSSDSSAAPSRTGSSSNMSALLSATPSPPIAPQIRMGSSGRTSYSLKPTGPIGDAPPLDESKFPKLPEVKKKPPRVNPVNNTIGSWGGGLNSGNKKSSGQDDPFDMGHVRQTKKGGKKKQSKVVYHIGV